MLKHPLTGESIWFNQPVDCRNNARSLGKPGYAYHISAPTGQTGTPLRGCGWATARRSRADIAPIYDLERGRSRFSTAVTCC